MAFKIIKLVSRESIIADVYGVEDLVNIMKNTPDGQDLLKNIETIPEKMVVLIDPVEIIMTKTESFTETSLELYMPYSEDFFLPIQDDKIITITNPNQKILNAYHKYVREIKEKLEMSKVLEEELGNDEGDEMLRELIQLDPKKATKH